MQKQSKQKFFEEQKIFVGIDVHAKQWHVYASPESGLGMRPVCMPPNAEALLSYLESKFPGGEYHSAYESGFCGFSNHRNLMNIGIHNIVFNAADLKTSNKERVRKTDAVDCKAIWENLSKGELKALYVPTETQEEDRELVRGREMCSKDSRRTKQRIKMFLHKLDTAVPTELSKAQSSWSKAYVDWLHEYSKTLNGGNRTKLTSLLLTLAHLEERISEYEKQMYDAASARHSEMFSLLITIPGIGKLSSAKICHELMDFSRFANDRHLAGYIGLVPDCRSSDTRETILGTSARRNKILKTTLIEAAWKAVGKDPALGSAYAKAVKRGQHPNVAITSIARRLVNRIFYVHRTRKEYVIGTK